MSTLRALTIKQPWAWAIAAGLKPAANRDRRTSHRGRLAIHADLTIDEDARLPTAEAYRRLAAAGGLDGIWRTSEHHLGHPLLAAGAIIAVADLSWVCTDILGCACGPWAEPGQAHWQFTNVCRLARPVPYRGAQGLWPVPTTITAAVTEQMETRHG